jgi:poly(hydroxyalkanoate) depolymerase family esterase
LTPDYQNLLREATRLTRQGDLQAATAAIQAALGRGPGHAGDYYAADTDVIDVEARVLPSEGDAVALPSAAGTDTTAPVAQEERFIDGRFGGAGVAGRDYKLYIPPGAGGQPRPLVVMMHGCTQDPEDFARGTQMNEAAREHGFYVLYPAQSPRANPQKCWNWFKPTHQQRGRGEAGLLAGMTRQVMAQHAIDPARVYVAGLSAGGAMAAVLAQAYPDLFAAVGVHSGLPAGAARDLPSALEAMKQGSRRAPSAASPVPTIVFHGTADPTVHPANGEQAFSAVAGNGPVATEAVQAAGGRRSTRRLVRDAGGKVVAEHWQVQDAPHAWSGGSPRGSYTDPKGPDATREMVRFFLQHVRFGTRPQGDAPSAGSPVAA